MSGDQRQAVKNSLKNIEPGVIETVTHSLSGEVKIGRISSGFEKNKGRITTFSLYPGIELSFIEFLAEAVPCMHKSEENVLEINYCRLGKISRSVKGTGAVCLGTDDFSVHSGKLSNDSHLSFPNGCYGGLKISADLDMLEKSPPEILKDAAGVKTLEKFCTADGFLTMPVNEKTKHIFNGFYDTPHRLALAYYKLKTQELLLYLLGMKLSGGSLGYRPEQIEVIKQVHELLTQKLDRRITIEELSKRFCMNPSSLKEIFKAVYGNSLAAHIKEHRMEKAAALLKEGKDGIAAVAKAVGYDSQSKFSAEFKKAYHVTPAEYKKTHR